MKISQLGEKKLIRRLLKKRDEKLPNTHPMIIQSYHDDAAIQPNTTKYTTLSTDMLIEHTHFPKKMTPYDMGAKSVCVNVSDIIAMNSKPESILISLGLPPTMSIDEFDNLIDGILDTCEKYDITLIGGDLNTSDEIIISATSVGISDGNIKFLNNIQKNNLIAVTGKLGSPAAAYDLIYHEDADIPEIEKQEIIDSFIKPTIPYDTFKFLHKHPKLIMAMTDITDGLAVELGHLHDNNNGYGFKINKELIPYNKYIKQVAKRNNKKLNDYLLHFGEEFELLLILDENEYIKYKDQLEDITVIGYVNCDDKITILVNNGKEFEVKTQGYEHLSGEK